MVIIKIILVTLTVIITLFTAILLNYAAKENSIFTISTLLTMFLVLILNFIKFKIWGIIHNNYNLSESYPLISLFFPLIYIVAIYNGEAILEINKIIGIIFILCGIYVMHSQKESI